MIHLDQCARPEQYINTRKPMSLWYPRDEAISQLYNSKDSRGLSFDEVVTYCSQSLSAIAKVAAKWELQIPDVDVPEADLGDKQYRDIDHYLFQIKVRPRRFSKEKIRVQLESAHSVLRQTLFELSSPEDLKTRLEEIEGKIEAHDVQLTEQEILLQVLSGERNNSHIKQKELGTLFGLQQMRIGAIIRASEGIPGILHIPDKVPSPRISLAILASILSGCFPQVAQEISLAIYSEDPLSQLRGLFQRYLIEHTADDSIYKQAHLVHAFLTEGYITDASIIELQAKLDVLTTRNYRIETPDFADMSLLEQSRLNTLVDSAFPGTSLEANIGFFAANVVAVARRNDGIPYGIGVLGLHDFYSARNGNPLSDLAVFCFNTAVVDQDLWGVGTGRALISARFDALVNGSFFEKIRNMYSTNTDRLQALKEGMWIAYADFSDVGMLRAFLEEGAHRGLIPTSLTKGVLGEAGLIDDLRDEKVNGVKCSHFTFKYGDRGTLDINGQEVPVHKRLIHRYILLNGNEGTDNLLHTIRQDFANYQWSGKWEGKKDGRFWRFDEQQVMNCEQDYLSVMAGGDLEPIVFENTFDPILFPEEWRREQARQVALFNEAVIENAGKETPVLLQAPEPVAYRVAVGPKIEEE